MTRISKKRSGIKNALNTILIGATYTKFCCKSASAFTIQSPSPSLHKILSPLYMASKEESVEDDSFLFASSPQESKSDKEKSSQILQEIDGGSRDLPTWFFEDYQEEIFDELTEDDDPNAIDPETLGKWDESDLEGRLEYEYDPAKGHEDPNILNPKFEHVDDIPVDEEGVELMYDPVFGRANPIDERTIINPQDSYIIDDETRDDAIVTPTFPEGDIEIDYNADITTFRKSLKIVETFVDPYLEMEVPRHKAKWYGYPEQINYPDKPDIENRFTKPEEKTDFDSLTPYRARKKAIELARSKNNEWLPQGKSIEFHNSRTEIFKKKGLLVGSLMKGEIDPEVKERIQSALDVLGSCAELIEINGTVFRFHYHGLIKNKRGMAAWTQTLITDCGVECTGVVLETGWRKRDPYYDGGDKWFGPY